MTFIRFSAQIVVLLAVAVAAGAGEAPPFHYAHRAWQVGQGLPHSTVFSIVQDRAGYIWVGTLDGLARFDGVRFTSFNKQNVEHFGSNWIRRLHVGRDGSLWALNGGVVRLKDGVFRSWPQSMFPDSPYDIGEAADGTLWLATHRGLVRFRDGAIRTFTTADGLGSDDLTSVVVESTNVVWVGTRAGLFRYDGHRFRNVKLPETWGKPLQIFATRDGAVLIATATHVIESRNDRFTIYPLGAFAGRRLNTVHRDSKGTLRVGFDSGDGIARFDGGRFVKDSATDLLTERSINTIFEDREGILWVGTEFGGLSQLRATPLTTYGTTDGLAGRSTLGLVADDKGGVWIGTAGQGLTHYQGGRFRSYGTKDGLAHGYVNALEHDSKGDLWIGTWGGGVQRFSEGRFTSITKTSGLRSNAVSDVHSDGRLMWFATSNGLTAYDGAQFRHYGEREGLSSGFITRIAGTEQQLWIGTSAGLDLLQNGSIRKTSIRGWVRSLYKATDGTVWATVEDQGLWRIRNGRITRFTKRDGLFDESINSVLDDGDGNLWLAGTRGVFCVRLRDLDRFERTGRKFRSEYFSSSDGMASPETSYAAAALVRDRDGRLWISTASGVVVLDPAALKRRPSPRSSAVIESIVADGAALPAGQFVVRPGTRHVVFHYAGIHFMAPEEIRFRYRLLGFDRDWVDAAEQRQAHYTRLRAGRYRLEIETRVKDGAWGGRITSAVLTVSPFFWETMAFRIGALLFIVLFPFATLRLRLVQLRRRERTLRKLVRERTKLLASAKERAEEASELNREISRRNRLVLDTAAEGIAGLDGDGRVVFINPTGAALLGWPPEELIGRELHSIVHPTEESLICPICATPAQRENPNTYGTFLMRGGTPVTVEFTLGTDERAVVITFRDATARLALERAKNEFVATVSHELKTPLTSIRGALGLLHSGKVQADAAHRMLEVAMSNSDRLLRLVNEILDAERLASGAVELSRTRFMARTAITHAVEVMHALADRASVRLETGPLDVEIDADFDRLIQTFTNLISNAIKFSPPQSVVRVSVEREGCNAVFRVTDQGRGIPPEKLERVFERFQQVELGDATKKGGSGLGLAICRSIAEAHGGTITVNSVLGIGSTFAVILPLEA